MDRFIAAMPAEQDSDLMLCPDFGVAYQKDQHNLVAYDRSYYGKCQGYEGQPIANAINAGRIALVDRHFRGTVVDVGIGSGEFIRRRGNTWGHDVNPAGIEWLKRNDLWTENIGRFKAVTFWDVVEHIPTPEDYFSQMQAGTFAFFSVPIVSLDRVRESRHYRPGEHLYYFEEDGFVRWMAMHGFSLLEVDTFEMKAGRDSIYSFAFIRSHA